MTPAPHGSGSHAPRGSPRLPTLRVEPRDAERRRQCVPTQSVETRGYPTPMAPATFLHVLVLLAVGGLLLPGCTGRPQSAGEALRWIDAPGLEQAIKEHRGQVVLVDFWATWCEPCVKLFPHAAELQQRFRNRGLAVVTVSLDDTADRDTVGRFLADKGATTENFLSSYGVGPEAFTAFGIDDGALPHLRLYDAEGTLRKTFASGGRMIDPKEIDSVVEGLLK